LLANETSWRKTNKLLKDVKKDYTRKTHNLKKELRFAKDVEALLFLNQGILMMGIAQKDSGKEKR